MFVLLHYYPGLVDILSDYRSATVTGVIILITATGLLIEDLGSWYESGILDKRRIKEDADYFPEWYEYLSQTFKTHWSSVLENNRHQDEI